VVKIEREQALQWLNEKWKEPRECPICKGTKWSLMDELLELRPFEYGRIIMGQPPIPIFIMICATCGYFLPFSAVLAKGIAQSTESTA
jgi:hypothetical protein